MEGKEIFQFQEIMTEKGLQTEEFIEPECNTGE